MKTTQYYCDFCGENLEGKTPYDIEIRHRQDMSLELSPLPWIAESLDHSCNQCLEEFKIQISDFIRQKEKESANQT